MSKNAWSFGCRFVAVAALAIGASSALAGTAAANDGTRESAGCPSAASAGGSAGCHKAEKSEKSRTRPDDYGRSHHRPVQHRPVQRFEERSLGAFVIIESMRKVGSGGWPLTDPFGLAASRGLDSPMPLRIDPRAVTRPVAAAPGTLSTAPSLPDPYRLTVAGRVVERTPREIRKAEVEAKLRDLPKVVVKTTDELGVLLDKADAGKLLTPAANVPVLGR